VAPIEISIVVHPNGTWEGTAHLSLVPPSPSPSDWEEALDAQVQRVATAILGDRGIHSTWKKSPNEPLNENEKGVVSYSFFLEGEDAREIAEAALDAGNVTKRLEGPVALELSGAIREDQALEITLPANPSTGYAWEIDGLDERRLPQVNGVETHQVSKGLGVPARQVIRLRAMETGEADFRLVYRRPWQADLPPTMVLSIQPDDLDLADVCTALSAPPPSPALAPALAIQGEGEEEEQRSPTLQQDTSLPSVQSLPSAYNWCDAHDGCPPVRDQGQCGSCWAFGTVGPLEAWVKYRNKISIDLSEQYLVSCNNELPYKWGCDGGWWAHDYHLNKSSPGEPQAGAVLESGFPYVAADVPCSGPYNHPHRITSWTYIGSGSSIPSTAAIKQAIYDYGPVPAAICIGNGFRNYTGGVFQTHETCDGIVNHAIILVGWDDSQQAWTLRNSWGSSWGENGYMRIRYGTSSVGFSANYVEFIHTPFVASKWVYLPLVTRDSGAVYTVSNGNFESGSDGSWNEYSSNGWPLILDTSDLPASPHGGNWAAWMGGDSDETSILSQQVTIPSNGTTLNYWYWGASEDYCGYDYAYVRFGATTLGTHDLCGFNNTGGWTSQQINVTSWQGQSVELRFVVETDGSLNSNFFLDDVSISTTVASSDPSISPDSSGASGIHATVPKGSR